ncbi:hypothetical protein KY284_010790 [Solanum tuberosum]|nr:hypothetical protein KY284_010790 [Solanum tuberosum]
MICIGNLMNDPRMDCRAPATTTLSANFEQIQNITEGDQRGISIKAEGFTNIQNEGDKAELNELQMMVNSHKMIESTGETRGINTPGVMGRVTNLIKIQHLSMVSILEPFTDNSHLNRVRISFCMDKATCNKNGKICLFWNLEGECKVLESDEQQITWEISHVTNPITHLITVVYIPNPKNT